jgi:hypothetical protein
MSSGLQERYLERLNCPVSGLFETDATKCCYGRAAARGYDMEKCYGHFFPTSFVPFFELQKNLLFRSVYAYRQRKIQVAVRGPQDQEYESGGGLLGFSGLTFL